METSGLFSTTIVALEKNLDLRAKKHNMITSNVANIDTPNYRSFNFEIEQAMERVMSKKSETALRITNPGHIRHGSHESMTGVEQAIKGIIKEEKTGDIDKAMMDLSQNSILYNASAQILSRKYNKLKQVINGGNQ
jgi:flagellar basal-body rod protein FlgB